MILSKRYVFVDPADTIKLGIKWEGDVFIDVVVAFGWVHGSALFQRISDTIKYIMDKAEGKMIACIDDCILVSEQHFQPC